MLREVDAAAAHFFGLDRQELEYVISTFQTLGGHEVARYGHFRTREMVLRCYDAMAEAAATDQPYRTLLDPPPVELDLAASKTASATVTPLRSPVQPEPEPSALNQVAEEGSAYEVLTSLRRSDEPDEQAKGAAEAEPAEETRSRTASPAHQDPDEPQDALFEPPAPEVLSLDDAALALHACVPNDQKVERHALLSDAARELGHLKLTKKVRRALNQALNAEKNAGRLKTDWERVWKPRKKR
jgi:hypothetical protein